MAANFVSLRKDSIFWDVLPRSRAKFVAAYGVNWLQVREMLKSIMLNPFVDKYIIENIQDDVIRSGAVPIRTGHLLDFIFHTMKIIRRAWYKTQYTIMGLFHWPTVRPFFIRNPRHTVELGYANAAKQPNLASPKVSAMVRLVKPTGPKRGYWLLNDPVAIETPEAVVRMLMDRHIFQDLVVRLSAIKLVIHI
jgi:hypothetical protein